MTLLRGNRVKWRNVLMPEDELPNGNGGGYSYPVTVPVAVDPVTQVINSIVGIISPILQAAPVISKDYLPQDTVSFNRIEPVYVAPVQNLVSPKPALVLEPVETPKITYIDPALDVPDTPVKEGSMIEPKPVTVLQVISDVVDAVVNPEPEPVVNVNNEVVQDKPATVLETISDIVDVITNKEQKVVPLNNDRSFLYIALAVAGIGMVALLFKK